MIRKPWSRAWIRRIPLGGGHTIGKTFNSMVPNSALPLQDHRVSLSCGVRTEAKWLSEEFCGQLLTLWILTPWKRSTSFSPLKSGIQRWRRWWMLSGILLSSPLTPASTIGRRCRTSKSFSLHFKLKRGTGGGRMEGPDRTRKRPKKTLHLPKWLKFPNQALFPTWWIRWLLPTRKLDFLNRVSNCTLNCTLNLIFHSLLYNYYP